MKIPIQNLQREYTIIKKGVEKTIIHSLNSAQYTHGEIIHIFENNFAAFCNSQYCIATGSGTDSLLLALRAIGIQAGDEVITSPLTFVATAEAIILAGGTPVFVDIDPKTWNIDPQKIDKAITNKTKAIIPVHLYGVCCDMDAINILAKEHKLVVIEDAAHAQGSLYKGKRAGSLGDIGCFSFYPTKTLGAYGNAGAITTNNRKFAQKLRSLADHGRTTKRYTHNSIGQTATMDTLQAAILQEKMKYLPTWIHKRYAIVSFYRKYITAPVQSIGEDIYPSYYVFTLRVKNRNTVKIGLQKKGIGTQVYYPVPLHLQRSLSFLGYKPKDFPIVEQYTNELLSLPLYPSLTQKELHYIISALFPYGLAAKIS